MRHARFTSPLAGEVDRAGARSGEGECRRDEIYARMNREAGPLTPTLSLKGRGSAPPMPGAQRVIAKGASLRAKRSNLVATDAHCADRDCFVALRAPRNDSFAWAS